MQNLVASLAVMSFFFAVPRMEEGPHHTSRAPLGLEARGF